jgi:two-component system phosphate regulon sensor histidine kinase PhoR
MDILAVLVGLALGVLLVLVWQSSLRGGGPIPLALQSARGQLPASQTQIPWETLFEHSPLGYLQVDAENRLFWCSAKARELLAVSYWDAAKPRLLLEVVRSYELDQLIELVRETQVPQQREWILHPVSANPTNPARQPSRALRGSGVPLPTGQVGVFLENRQEVVQLIQQRNRCASDVAHELKTPLTSIRLVAETLQARLEPPLQLWADRLLTEVIRLSTLVQDLLDISRLEKGSLYCLKRTAVDLAQLIHSAWQSLEPLAQQHNLVLNYQGPSTLLVQVDESRLYRVLLNLLDNSIKYSPTGGAIAVKAKIIPPSEPQIPQQVHLEIIDSGTGFPEESIPHVFERFYRADSSRTRHFGAGHARFPSSGSGLGLAIVRQIVEAHQGSISASNHPETGGAWLQVWLPNPA